MLGGAPPRPECGSPRPIRRRARCRGAAPKSCNARRGVTAGSCHPVDRDNAWRPRRSARRGDYEVGRPNWLVRVPAIECAGRRPVREVNDGQWCRRLNQRVGAVGPPDNLAWPRDTTAQGDRGPGIPAGGAIPAGSKLATVPGAPYCRYCWIRVVRKPARPWRSMEYCQARNSSTVSV
jgi:hypothetical protein